MAERKFENIDVSNFVETDHITMKTAGFKDPTIMKVVNDGWSERRKQGFLFKNGKKLAIGDLEEFRKINMFDGVAIISLREEDTNPDMYGEDDICWVENDQSFLVLDGRPFRFTNMEMARNIYSMKDAKFLFFRRNYLNDSDYESNGRYIYTIFSRQYNAFLVNPDTEDITFVLGYHGYLSKNEETIKVYNKDLTINQEGGNTVLKTYDMIELTENDIMLNTLRSRCQIIPFGNYFQKTTNGGNLLNIEDGTYYNSPYNTEHNYVVIKDGEMIDVDISSTNSYGITIPLKTDITLKANESYTRSNYSGQAYPYVTLKNENTTIDSMSLSDNGTKTYTPTEDKTITAIYLWIDPHKPFTTLKLMMNKGTSILPFEPYTGEESSPSASFPQPIEVVTGDNTIILENENGNFKQIFPLTLGNIELVKITNNVSDSIMGSINNWYVFKNTHKIVSYDGETVSPNYLSTTGGLDTGATIYYEIAIPYLDKIKNETLITELNNLYEKSTCYDGKTYIHVQNENGNAPLELKIKLLQERN